MIIDLLNVESVYTTGREELKYLSAGLILGRLDLSGELDSRFRKL